VLSHVRVCTTTHTRMHVSDINTPTLALQVERNFLCQITFLIKALRFSGIIVVIIRFFYDGALFLEDKVGALKDL
jgi:hypothetical protein